MKNKRKKANPDAKYKIIIPAIFGTIILIAYISGKIDRNDIEQHKGIAMGRVTGGNLVLKPPSYELMYSYSVGETYYQNLGSGIHIDRDDMKYFAWQEFPVIYSKAHPKRSYLLVFPNHFEAWNMSFPDSLKWVFEHGEVH